MISRCRFFCWNELFDCSKLKMGISAFWVLSTKLIHSIALSQKVKRANDYGDDQVWEQNILPFFLPLKLEQASSWVRVWQKSQSHIEFHRQTQIATACLFPKRIKQKSVNGYTVAIHINTADWICECIQFDTISNLTIKSSE